LRLKILGLMALAALVAAMGTIGLSQKQSAFADAVPGVVAVSTGTNTWQLSGFFNEDDNCSNGPSLCPAIVTVTPLANVTSLVAATVACTIDLNNNGTIADESAVATNCAGALADSDTAVNVYTYSAAVVAALDADTINELWRLQLNLTANCLVSTVLTITYQQDTNSVPQTTSVTCGTSTVHTIGITKIDQFGTLKAATFGLGGPGFSTAGAVMATGVTSSTNPCVSNSSTGCATNPNLNNQNGQFLPIGNTGGITLPLNSPIEIREIGNPTYSGGPSPCTLVEIKLGTQTSITVLPLANPPVATFDGASWTVTSGGIVVGNVPGTALNLTYVNSCVQAGGATAANSSIAVVIGGSTQGLTNSTHIEIVPAPGSDDDARLDIRVRDQYFVPLVNAHVTVLTDRGAIALRADTTSTVTLNGVSTPTGYDVIEPAPGGPGFGSNRYGDTCDQSEWSPFTQAANPGLQLGGLSYNGTVASPIFTGSRQIQDGYTNTDGIVSACLFASDTLAPGITPGKANIQVIIENASPYTSSYQPFYAPQNLVLTTVVTVVGPPASVKVAASPTTLQCGEKSTITATITDAVGQNVSDHTRVELVSNFGSTIGGTGATLGFPGTGPTNPISSSAAETFSGVATAFLLTSTEHVGPYEVVVATGGSTGGYAYNNATLSYVQPGVVNTVGAFSTAPVNAQVTVTCALPTAAVAPIVPPIVAPRTGEGIRPPNTGDAGLLTSVID